MSKPSDSSKDQPKILISIIDALGLQRRDVPPLAGPELAPLSDVPVTASSLMGSVPAIKGDWKEIRELAWRIRAEEIMKKGSSATPPSSSDS